MGLKMPFKNKLTDRIFDAITLFIDDLIRQNSLISYIQELDSYSLKAENQDGNQLFIAAIHYAYNKNPTQIAIWKLAIIYRTLKEYHPSFSFPIYIDSSSSFMGFYAQLLDCFLTERLIKEKDYYYISNVITNYPPLKEFESDFNFFCDELNKGCVTKSHIEMFLLQQDNQGLSRLDYVLYNDPPKYCEAFLRGANKVLRRAIALQIIDASTYSSFIFHEYTSLHSALLNKNSFQNTYLYIQASLHLISQGFVSLEQFRQILITKNAKGLSPLHQAVDNEFYENAELILNLLKVVLSKEEYQYELNQKTSNHGKIPYCAIDKPDYLRINNLLSEERETSSIHFFQPTSKKASKKAYDERMITIKQSIPLIRLAREKVALEAKFQRDKQPLAVIPGSWG